MIGFIALMVVCIFGVGIGYIIDKVFDQEKYRAKELAKINKRIEGQIRIALPEKEENEFAEWDNEYYHRGELK